MNECKFCFFHFTPRIERWRRGRRYPMFKSLRQSTVERLNKDVFVRKERSSVLVYEKTCVLYCDSSIYHVALKWRTDECEDKTILKNKLRSHKNEIMK